MLFGVFLVLGCDTKRDLKRQQEYEKIKQEVREAKGARADLDVLSEELRTEMTRLSTGLKEQGQLSRQQNEEIRKDLAALSARVQALEALNSAAAAAAAAAGRPPRSGQASKSCYSTTRKRSL